MLMKNYFIFLIIWILLVLESHAQLRWIGKVCFFFREKINIYENRFSRILQASYFYARSERSAQLLAFKRENFAYSRTKISHFSMCPFRGCGFTYGKKTSLLHESVLSYFKIVEIISPNTREITWSASFTCWTTDIFQALLKDIFSWVCFLPDRV